MHGMGGCIHAILGETRYTSPWGKILVVLLCT